MTYSASAHPLAAVFITDDETPTPPAKPALSPFVKLEGEDWDVYRARLIRDTSEGLKRNFRRPCPVSRYFGLPGHEATDE